MKSNDQIAGVVKHRLLAGFYDLEKREQEVFKRFDHGCERIHKSDLHKHQIEPKRITPQVLQDKTSQMLNDLLEDFKKLKLDSENFVGTHFNKKYRCLQERSTKLVISLDNLDVMGKEDLRDQRKSVLIEVNKMSKCLAQKVHQDEERCKDCEI